MFKKKNRIITLLIITFILILSILYYIISINQTQKINLNLQKNLSNLKINYKMLIYNQKMRTNSLVSSLFREEKIKNIMIKANKTNSQEELKILRDKLYKLLKKRYEILLKEGILQFHIVFPNNKTFLRMHKPSKFNDDVSLIRKDMKFVNENQTAIYGFNQGKTSHSFKNIIPIFYDNQYMGLVDIAYTSQSLQQYLNNVGKMHTHFLVKKNIFAIKKWEQDKVKLNYIQAIEHKNYMISISKHINLTKYKDEPPKNLTPIIFKKFKEELPFVLYNKNHENKANSIAYYPIKNTVSKKVSAWIVSYEINESLNLYEKDKNLFLSILFIVWSIIFIFIYKTIMQKEILNEQVKQKTLKLSKINKKLVKSQKELKSLNLNLKSTIQKEVLTNIKTQEELFRSKQLSSMGEMIGNIAHQWRQPLSIITTQSSSMLLQKECNLLKDETIIKSCISINDNAQYLSKTIDDFKNFIKGDKEKETFSLSKNMNSLLNLINPTIKNNNINLICNFDNSIHITSYANELNQCLINIVNNAQDALMQINSTRYIFISTYVCDNKVHIRVKDNANGIKEDILLKIFDPYFTTKHKSIGTGLGLNMAHNIITKHLNGQIDVQNVEYLHNNKEYKGAQFIISLNINC